MQVLRITKNSGIYFLDIVENNSAKNLANGSLFYIDKVLPDYIAMYPKAYVKRIY